MIELQKIEAVDEKRKRGARREGGPEGQKVWRENQERGVDQRWGARGRNWVILSKIPDQALGGAGAGTPTGS